VTGKAMVEVKSKASILAFAPGRRPYVRVISDCHPSEGAYKNRTQIPIIHMFYFSAPSSLE
jgi:hypothetical protein